MSFFKQHKIILFIVLYFIIGFGILITSEILNPNPESDICIFCWPSLLFWSPIMIIFWPYMIIFSIFSGRNQLQSQAMVEIVIVILLFLIWYKITKK